MRAKGLLILLVFALVAPNAAALPVSPDAIVGTVTDADGDPIDRACVWLFRGFDYFPETSRVTDADGTYAFPRTYSTNRQNGPFSLGFSDCTHEGRFATEFYKDVLDPRDATAIYTDTFEPTEVNATMNPGVTISGFVDDADNEPIEGICINARTPQAPHVRFMEFDQHHTADITTAADGTFTRSGLAPGAYTIEFWDCRDGAIYADQFYPDSRARMDAAQLTLGDGDVVGNIDATLSEGARISGAITNGGEGIRACVDVVDQNKNTIAWGWSEDDGTYTTSFVAPGAAFVWFYDCDDTGFDSEYYDDAYTVDDAEQLVLSPGEGRTGIDADLSWCERSPDTDGDGLSDCEERAVGTLPDEVDTDRDGLPDGDEVNTYRTSPIDTDTDGDLFSDGFEVRGGQCTGQDFEGGSDPNDPTSTPLTPDQHNTVLRMPVTQPIC